MNLRRLTLAVAFAALALLTLGPLVYLLVYGASAAPGSVDAAVPGGGGGVWALFCTTLTVSCTAALIGVALGVANAGIVHRLPRRWAAALTVLLVLPLVIPPYVHAVTWIALLGHQGILSRWMSACLGGRPSPLTIYGVWGCGFVLGLSYFPISFLLALRGLRRMDPAMERAGVLVAGEVRRFFGLCLPLAAKDILLGAGLILLMSFGQFGVPALLRVNTWSVEVFTQFSAYYDFRSAARQGLPMLAFVLGVWVLGVVLVHRGARTHTKTGQDRLLPPAGRWIAILPMATIALSAAPPIVVLLKQAGGLEAFTEAVRTAGAAARMSACVGLGAAAVSVLLAFLICSAMRGYADRWLPLVPLFALLGVAVPPAIVGIGLIGLCNRPGLLGELYGSPGILVVAVTARFSALAIIPVYCALEGTELAGEQAAEISGVPWLRRALRLHAPICRRAAGVGLATVFIFALGELGASILVAPPGSSTAPIRVFSLLHYSRTETAAALCLIMAAVAILPICVYALIANKAPEFFSNGQDRV